MMKGQSSMELLVTVGIVLAFTIPVAFLLLSLTMVGYEDASIAQADASARSLADSINVVYSQGDGAKREMLLNLPSNTEAVHIGENEVVIEVRTGSGIHQAAAPYFAETSTVSLDPNRLSGLLQLDIQTVSSRGEIITEVSVVEEE
jgi:uncharacterized protein (UPF0333 family)